MKKILVIVIILSFKTSQSQTDSSSNVTLAYFINSAVALEQKKQYQEALLYVDSALKIESSNHNIYEHKAEILWLMKRFREAAENQQKSLLLVQNDIDFFGTYLLLGILYEKANMPTQAQLQYLKTVYFFEHRKGKENIYSEVSNKIDYTIALKLSRNDSAWEKLLSNPQYKSLRERYSGKSREEVLEIYFKPFSED